MKEPAVTEERARGTVKAIVIWDVLSALKTRGRYCEGPTQGPMYKRSHEGQLYARPTLATLEMLETPSRELEEENSLTLRETEDFPSVKPAVNRILVYDTQHKARPLVRKCFQSMKRLGPGVRLPFLKDY